ncbi:hypothetical protein [Acetomicrobium sp.]|uniref:hypothetical protein n=1 Tax=Acetomicrobium sp. TaxID=1872099 RepID=UPI002FCB3013
MTTEIGGHYLSGAVRFKEKVERVHIRMEKVRVDIFRQSTRKRERFDSRAWGWGL